MRKATFSPTKITQLRIQFVGPEENGSPSATNVVLVVSTKAFSFHNRSSSNLHIGPRLMTIFSRIAPC